jgi:hypothetical protein
VAHECLQRHEVPATLSQEAICESVSQLVRRELPTPGRDISTGGEQAHTSIRDSSIESREKSWFARHPWVSGIIIGLATGVLPTIYIAVWGLHLP